MAPKNIFESSEPQAGQRATENAHRKIELQSPLDMQYLIANVQRAAREKLDRHLPPDAAPEGEDAMRKRVEELVDEYIRNTFNAAKDSMSINGMDSNEMEAELAKAQEGEGTNERSEIEPFDTKLAQRMQSVSAQIEIQTLQLATLRRTAPAETSQRFQDSFTKQVDAYDARIQKDEAAKLEAARNTKLDIGEVERLDEIQNTWQTRTENLVALKSGLGGTVAKMERAQSANEAIEGR